MQVTFRYQTRLCDDDQTVIDDNRKDTKPMELIFGKKFKLEVWETCLKSMRVDEVASYIVDASVCLNLISILLMLFFLYNWSSFLELPGLYLSNFWSHDCRRYVALLVVLWCSALSSSALVSVTTLR